MIQQTTNQRVAESQTADPLLTAMHLIEQASELLVQAGIELNHVGEARGEYTRLCNTHERVHYLWGRVRDRREALRDKQAVEASHA